MFTGTEIGLALTTVGSVAGAVAVYFKTRGSSNGNGKPKFCSAHEALVQNVDGIKDDVKEVKDTINSHTETIANIGRSTARIEGLLEGMARNK